MGGVRKVLRIIHGPSPSVSAAGVVLLMVRVGYDLVALMALVWQELLQGNDTGDQERDLGKEDGLDSGEGDDSEQQGDEGGDLQLGKGEEGQELLDLLLLATSCGEARVDMSRKIYVRRILFHLFKS